MQAVSTRQLPLCCVLCHCKIQRVKNNYKGTALSNRYLSIYHFMNSITTIIHKAAATFLCIRVRTARAVQIDIKLFSSFRYKLPTISFAKVALLMFSIILLSSFQLWVQPVCQIECILSLPLIHQVLRLRFLMVFCKLSIKLSMCQS